MAHLNDAKDVLKSNGFYDVALDFRRDEIIVRRRFIMEEEGDGYRILDLNENGKTIESSYMSKGRFATDLCNIINDFLEKRPFKEAL